MPNLISEEGYSQCAAIATVDGNNTPLTWTTAGTADALKIDTVDLPGYTLYRSMMVSVAGTVKINDWDGNPIAMTLAAGVIYPIRPRRLWSTGTTATGIVLFRASAIND